MSYTEAYPSHDVGFSWAEESTYRTRPANIDEYLRVIKQTPPFAEKEVTQQHAFGHGRAPAYASSRGKISLNGSVTIEVIDGKFLGAILGTCVTTGAGPYTHTISVTNLKSFAVQIPFIKTGNNLITEFLGCRVDQAIFKASDENPVLQADIDYMAATHQDGGGSAETVSLSTVKPYLFKMGVLTSSDMWGGAVGRIHGFELPIKNNCKPEYVGGYQYYPYEIAQGKLEYGDMKVTVGLEDDTEWDELLDDTDKEYDLTYLFTRAASDTLQFTINNAKLKAMPVDLDDNNVKAALTLIPSSVEIVVIDTDSAYPFE